MLVPPYASTVQPIVANPLLSIIFCTAGTTMAPIENPSKLTLSFSAHGCFCTHSIAVAI